MLTLVVSARLFQYSYLPNYIRKLKRLHYLRIFCLDHSLPSEQLKAQRYVAKDEDTIFEDVAFESIDLEHVSDVRDQKGELIETKELVDRGYVDRLRKVIKKEE